MLDNLIAAIDVTVRCAQMTDLLSSLTTEKLCAYLVAVVYPLRQAEVV